MAKTSVRCASIARSSNSFWDVRETSLSRPCRYGRASSIASFSCDHRIVSNSLELLCASKGLLGSGYFLDNAICNERYPELVSIANAVGSDYLFGVSSRSQSASRILWNLLGPCASYRLPSPSTFSALQGFMYRSGCLSTPAVWNRAFALNSVHRRRQIQG